MKQVAYLYDTVDMPTWAMTYLEYGYCDNLTERDEETIKNWLKSLPTSPDLNFTLSYFGDIETTKWPEIGPKLITEYQKCHLFLIFGVKFAQTLAANWHGGQRSALHSFASTGQITDKERLLAEISECSANALPADVWQIEALSQFIINN